MRTTDSILADLHKRQAAGEDVRQQIIAHEQLARLRAELATVPDDQPDRKAGLESQVVTWRGLVDEDVDLRIVEAPGKDSTTDVDGVPAVKRR